MTLLRICNIQSRRLLYTYISNLPVGVFPILDHELCNEQKCSLNKLDYILYSASVLTLDRFH